MSLKYKIYQSEYPYHIFNRTNNKEFIFDLNRDFSIFTSCLKYIQKKTDFRLHHFILMGNHYHIIGSTPCANLNEIMRGFQTLVSHLINEKTGRINHIFGNRYGATVVQSEIYLSYLIRYVYQNPVKAGIVQNAMLYPYSSAVFYLKNQLQCYGLTPDPYLGKFDPMKRSFELSRLCETYLSEGESNLIGKKLKKTIFNFE